MNRRSRRGGVPPLMIALLVLMAVLLIALIWVSVWSARRSEPSPGQPDGQQAQTQQTPETDAPGEQAQERADTPAAAAPTEPPAPTQSPAPSTLLAETPDAGQEYIDKIVFLGDSTTYGLRYYEVLPEYQVWTPASGTLALFNVPIETIEYFAPGTRENPENLSIADCAAKGKPEYLVITLGLNGIAFLDETSFKQYYRDMITSIQQASPDTKIILQSIYPVIDSMTTSDIKNDGINTANQWIYDLAEEMGLRYLNTHDALMDSTGNLIAAYNSGDGIHLMPDGLRAILQYVRTHAWQ